MLLVFLLLLQAPEAPKADAPKLDNEERRLDLTVDRCVELALQNNPDLSAVAYTSQAQSGSALAAEGTFDPIFGTNFSLSRAKQAYPSTFNQTGSTSSTDANQSLDFSLKQNLFSGGSYAFSFGNSRNETFPDVPGLVNPYISSTLNLTVTQPLLRGAWTTFATSGVVNAEIEKAKSEKEFDDRVMATIQLVHNAYWDLVFAIEDVGVKKFSLTLGERLLEINQKKVKEGVSAPVEVLQAETEIAIRREALITSENTQQAAEDSLKQLVFPFRQHSEWNFRLAPSSAVPEVKKEQMPAWEDALATAMISRPDLRRARLDLRQKDLAVEVAQSELLPKLDLSASRSSSAVQKKYPDVLDDLKSDDFPGYGVFVNFEIPLGNRGAKGNLQFASATRAAAKQILRSLENQVARDVRDAIRNLQFQKEKIAATAKSRELAQKQLEAEERKFEVGLSTNFQVLELQEDLVTAITNEKLAYLNHAKALIGLKKAQGQLRP